MKIGEAPEVDKQKLLDRAKRFGLAVGEDGKQAKETPAPRAATVKPAVAATATSVRDSSSCRLGCVLLQFFTTSTFCS